MEEIKNLLSSFTPISLEEMNKVSLLKRIDTKFLLHEKKLPLLLETLKETYNILEIDTQRLMTYHSLYFDTAALDFYHMHHNGRNNRIKIRKRTYVESQLSFLEVKRKNDKGQTVKTRVPTSAETHETLSEEEKQFIRQTTGKNLELQASIQNNFKRFTLAHLKLGERVTIDTSLSFDQNPFMPNLLVIELKQNKLNRNSPVYQSLKRMGCLPFSISKYCMGLASSRSDIKKNVFKTKFIKINKILTQ